MDPLIYLFVGLFLGGFIVWIIRKLAFEKNNVDRQLFDTLNNELISSKALLDLTTNEFEGLRSKIESLSKSNDDLKDYILKVKSENDVLKERNASIRKEIEEVGQKFSSEFKNLANEILEDKSKRFTETNQKNIKLILDPLNSDLKDFKKKVEETYEKENKQRFSLEEKIKDLVQLNQRISEEANNLTKALKGQRKTQGDWGEMILENVLQQSGLTEGREYFKQEFLRDSTGNTIVNEDGKKMQPDFLIRFPDNRNIIIDSKVSLSAYERFNSAESEIEQQSELQNHIDAIYNHVDGLSNKNYQQFTASLDYVMMFVAIEPAYLVAIQKDNNLWNYAFKKRIILISPTNLIAIVKLISELWKIDDQNKNAIEIAERGGKLYDKFYSFVIDLSDIGDKLNRARMSYEDAFKKLHTGNDNLVLQSEKMKKLGAKAKKQLPDNLLNDAFSTDEDVEGIIINPPEI